MDREQARQEIRANWRDLIGNMTERAKDNVNGEPSYVCPICGHGTHGDGLTVNKRSPSGSSLKCFGCGWSGDIIDLCRKLYECDYNTALESLAAGLRINIDSYSMNKTSGTLSERQKCTQETFSTQDDKIYSEDAKRSAEAETDYTAYYRACAERITDDAAATYLHSRGISTETAKAYMVGYDPEADPANAPGKLSKDGKLHPNPRIIIPTTKSHYIGRSIDPNTPKRYAKINPSISKGAGEAGIFNLEAIYAQDVQGVFVTEGAFDALSILDIGLPAIALNSVSNANRLVKIIEAKPTNATLILCLDDDRAGQNASDILKKELLRLNTAFIIADICNGHKDPNEALTSDRDAFSESAERVYKTTATKPDSVSYYINNMMGTDIELFKSNINTGFKNLDDQCKGIYAGLYVIAAISSLGKTTFASQLCDQIAAAGTDVVFISMEQSKLEMVSKGIARRTFQNNRETAVSSLSIRKGYITQAVKDAASDYMREIGDRVSVVEGNFNCDISFIGNYVRHYIKRNGTRPVLMVDYLQVLQPEQSAKGQSTKETIDLGITELKRISRELDIPVFVISSVNRANYLTPIDFESLKESGSIEYTADVIWGLQLQCLNDSTFNEAQNKNIKEKREKVRMAKASVPRKIELVCLKNRYGISSFSVYFDYFPANDCFMESTLNEFDTETEIGNSKRKRI